MNFAEYPAAIKVDSVDIVDLVDIVFKAFFLNNNNLDKFLFKI